MESLMGRRRRRRRTIGSFASGHTVDALVDLEPDEDVDGGYDDADDTKGYPDGIYDDVDHRVARTLMHFQFDDVTEERIWDSVSL
jgi:hypothetical protein